MQSLQALVLCAFDTREAGPRKPFQDILTARLRVLLRISLLAMSASSKESLLAVSGSLTGLSITFIGLRFYARRQQKLSLMADDWIVIPALVSVATTSHGPCFVSVDLLPILAYADLVYRSSGMRFHKYDTLPWSLVTPANSYSVQASMTKPSATRAMISRLLRR